MVYLVAGDEGENLGDSKLHAGAVVDGGEFEDGVVGVDTLVLGGGAARGVVVVAELLAAQGGRTAAVSGGMDVATDIARDGGFAEFGCVGHIGSPLTYEKVLKSSIDDG